MQVCQWRRAFLNKSIDSAGGSVDAIEVKNSDGVGEGAGEVLAGLATLLAAPAASGTLGGKPFLLGFGAEESTVL